MTWICFSDKPNFFQSAVANWLGLKRKYCAFVRDVETVDSAE
ncbi:hypothetical protein ADIARSV_4341 [Arcticibacter svalbardensis MN12-7]|uniref:Uncharacterized protein n=1 Tax=Arcticibacter svalbardensis MN12-7 TaxID=1150600 RepID=R9GLF7_9SPHI|nr:hypothetical protein ADIARSV_4341 [Arcticibacter svalbardensis MN12-7]